MPSDTEQCPHCGANLQGDPIDPAKICTPEEWALPWDQQPAGKYYAPDQTHFSRTIGYEDRDVYDGILYWMCPDCGGAWHRWSKDSSRRYQEADRQIKEINARLGIRT